MTTTAHAVPSLEVSAPDDMDLHSDSGLDFGDGDIELDLDPAPPTHPQDDDVSINDAASVGGLDAQTEPAEQDDFMADQEDLIEEDFDYQGDDVVVAPGQPSMINTAVPQVQTVEPPDEDLIDYSDDEVQEPQQDHVSSPSEEEVMAQDVQTEGSIEQQDEFQDNPQQLGSVSGEIVEHHDYQSQGEDEVDPGTNTQEANDQVQSPGHQGLESKSDDEEDKHTDGDDGGVLLQGHDGFADDGENEPSDHHDEADNDYTQANTAVDHEHQEEQSSELQPVTVNYAGNELWLFKHHDTDDSGDWLLEDLSVAKSSMSELFQACRSSLGDDVSSESEIGFRFDHLHNLELYEDNTACVAVSLERLVSLYHTLQAQDDNNEPESFYMSLLFRPRFVTLLSDIATYAEQGSGYAALDAAVAAGETHFTNVFSVSSSDEPTEWGNEEQGDDDEQEPADGEVQQGDDQGQRESQAQDNTQQEPEEERRQDDDNDHGNDEASTEVASDRGQDPIALTDTSSRETANASHVPANPQEAVDQPDEQVSQSHSEGVSESDARREQQKEEDLIDYSDEEVPEDAQEAEHAPVNDPSPLSSTVQGDEPPNAEDAGSLNTSTQENEKHNEPGAEAKDDGQSADQQLGRNDDTTQSYQDYVQDFDDDDPFQGFQAGEAEEFVDTQYDGDANQDYTGFEYEALDQQLQLDFLSGAEFHDVDNSTTAENDYSGTDGFLDLDNAPEWATDQEPNETLLEDAVLVHDDATTKEDEEDGVTEPPAVAASSTADLAADSSTELKDMSPQGQKRSIDEAGHGTDDALDSIDAKRPRV